jgi:hypothetical protein
MLERVDRANGRCEMDGMMELYERHTNMIPDVGCLCRLKVLLSGI